MSKKIAASPAPPSSSLFRRRHILGYLVLVALAVGLFVTVTGIYRRRVDEFQETRERYAAERGLGDLKKGDLEAARREVALLAQESPIGVTEGLFSHPFSNVEEGPVLRNRVSVYERLTAGLFDAGLTSQAETVGWKTLMEFHVASRSIEELIPWNLMLHLKLATGDWTSFFECQKILAAHGIDSIVKPSNLDPIPYPVRDSSLGNTNDPAIQAIQNNLKVFYEATDPREFQGAAAGFRTQSTAVANPIIKRRLRDMQHRALTAGGDRAGARALLEKIWGIDPATMDPFWRDWPGKAPQINLLDRDPTLMEYYWRDRPTSSSVTLPSFVDSFKGTDARVEVNDLSSLKAFQTGFFQPNNRVLKLENETLFFQSAGAALEFKLDDPVWRIYIAYHASNALRVYPIVLMKIDDQPYIPLYCDSTEPELLPVDVSIARGENHRIELLYLNDSGFAWPPKEIKEDRNISIYRMVFVHSKPAD